MHLLCPDYRLTVWRGLAVRPAAADRSRTLFHNAVSSGNYYESTRSMKIQWGLYSSGISLSG